MAENKGIMLAKSVQKHAGRAKEKILQNLGKVDRTADEIFDDHLNNFNRQQHNANRLQKEFNNYIRCIRAAQTASKSLMDAIAEIYEPNWSGYDALQAQAQMSESLWQDFAHKLADQVLIPLNTYTGQFPEMKKKVEKRNRKLIDYDGQRHSFQSLQANANKRKDDVKLTKGREQLEEARRTYELLNTELHDELPALYESRILFLVTNLQTLFATEQVFHNETAKIYSELEAIVDKLATESQRGSNTLRKATMNAIKSASPVQSSPVKQMNNANITNNSNQYQNTNGSANPPSPSSSTLESRQDNVLPRLLGSGGGDSSGINKMEASSTTSANLVTDATSIESTNTTITTTTKTTKETEQPTAQLNSPNANTTLASLNAKNEEESYNNATTPTTNEEKPPTASRAATKEDVDMNNAVATATGTETAAATGTAAATATPTTNQVTEAKKIEQMNGNDTANGNDINTVVINKTIAVTSTTANGNSTQAAATITQSSAAAAVAATTTTTPTSATSEQDEQTNKTKLDATTTDLPPGVLYRVKATYGYAKEDVDELSFEVGDIIRVIEYDDPEDQEEGWLMGEKEGTNEKGLFPANFTRPI